ncbi:uncharacterized protein LOC128676653 [Plodia interpunctella]|uniref:uncharacterized protein LOC128676653 n=1 Tax=Plodia interpunctella TaxID=58824 RepID=UPI002367B8B0|nr:uncharacterized protein LOC128676653 [Plodia interpunctella]
MPLIDFTDPAVIKFLVENYDRTARLRMKWNAFYGSKLQEAATLSRPEKGYTTYDVFKETMRGGMPAIRRDHITAGRNRKCIPLRDGAHIPAVADMKKGHSIVEVGLGDSEEDPRLARPDTDLSIDPLMRVIDPEQREMIYKELPFYGRKVYLKSRSKIPPEKKYYFSECSAWDYGWRLKDSYFSKNQPSYGRVWRLYRDVRNRSGPHPDPAHYNSAEIPNVNKCPK